MRCVAHLDMDAFYVAVELRRRPELRGLPVVVAGSGPRAVVTTASYEARRWGVGSAMPAGKARRLCSEAVFLNPDFGYYREVSAEVMRLVREQVPAVEVVGLDEAYLDLSGLRSPDEVMRRKRDQIERAAGLSCSIGIGPSKLVAKVASDAEKPRGFVVLSREQACERFAQAPCGLLPGIGPKTAERLHACGIGTLAQLAGAPAERLALKVGARLASELQRRARFEDHSTVSEQRKVLSESRETTFDQDIADPAKLEATLAQLVARLCAALAAQRREGRTVAIKVRLDDFSTHTRARTVSKPVSSVADVGAIALGLMRRFARPRPVRLLGVRVAGLVEASGDRLDQLTLTI